jgi:hypothetical protein
MEGGKGEQGRQPQPEPHRQLVVEQQLKALLPVLLTAVVQLVSLLQEGQHILRA